MQEKLTDKQVLEKIEKYMRLTRMPETDYYDISIGEITDKQIVKRGDDYYLVSKAK